MARLDKVRAVLDATILRARPVWIINRAVEVLNAAIAFCVIRGDRITRCGADAGQLSFGQPLDRRGSVRSRIGGARFRRATPVVAADTARTRHPARSAESLALRAWSGFRLRRSRLRRDEKPDTTDGPAGLRLSARSPEP
jgi:hypothetical protein